MAKITKSTTRDGRTMYKIAGTKKYAYSLAKAKEIAAKMGASTSSSGKRTLSPARRAAKKPLTARGVSKLGAAQVVALAVPRPTRARLMDFYRDIKEMGADALAERGISPATESFALKVRSALEDAMDKADGISRKKTASGVSAGGKPSKRRTTRKKTTRRNSRGFDTGPLPKGYFDVAPPVSRSVQRKHREMTSRYATPIPRRTLSGPVTITQMGMGPLVMPADLFALGFRAPIRPNTVDYLCETYRLTRKEAEAAVRAAADAPTDAWIEVRTSSHPRGGPSIRERRPGQQD